MFAWAAVFQSQVIWEEKRPKFVITQRTTRSSGYSGLLNRHLISIKCPEGTNENEYIMSLAARANEIQHRA